MLLVFVLDQRWVQRNCWGVRVEAQWFVKDSPLIKVGWKPSACGWSCVLIHSKSKQCWVTNLLSRWCFQFNWRLLYVFIVYECVCVDVGSIINTLHWWCDYVRLYLLFNWSLIYWMNHSVARYNMTHIQVQYIPKHRFIGTWFEIFLHCCLCWGKKNQHKMYVKRKNHRAQSSGICFIGLKISFF